MRPNRRHLWRGLYLLGVAKEGFREVVILAAVALVLILVPLGTMAWKSSRDFLSERDSHSILYHLLEKLDPVLG